MSPLLPLLIAALPAQSFAVVVGENRPLDETTAPLTYADDDAVASFRLLREAEVQASLLVSLDKETRRQYPDEAALAEAPTRAALEAALTRTFAAIEAAKASGARTTLYFVYSGHGDVANGEGYVALKDDRLGRSVLFEQILARSPADENHVIIDACRSYFMVFGKGPGGRRRPVRATVEDARERFANTGFILSTSSDRDSHEWARFSGGIFSHEVRSALRGAADADLDAVVTYRELGAFIHTANEAVTNPRFRPDAVVVPPRAGLQTPVLAWPTLDAIIVPAEAVLGHMVLEDHEGVRLADAHPAPQQALRLYTGARPVFLRASTGDREYEIRAPGPATLSPALARAAVTRPRGAAHLVFRALFSQPFSLATVSQYELQQRMEMSLTFEPPRATLDATRNVAPWVLGGAALIGASLTAAALSTRADAGGSQVDAQAANARIERLNTGAGVAYSMAGAAALWWLGVELYHLLDE